jgi:16S rRNA processing protein RimM
LPASARLVPVGIFGAPHGVRGELRVKSYTQDPATISAYEGLTDRTGRAIFKLTAARVMHDRMLVVRVAGVDSRQDAENLAGVELFVAREKLPPLPDDEFYHDDLVGLEALTDAGGRIGRVVALHNFGAGDILEIAPASGGETLMLPFSKAIAIEIDLDNGRIVIVPPREIEGNA